MQEFRAELHAAEAKDKKFVKRKTVLKKIVANITMGNDSAPTQLPVQVDAMAHCSMLMHSVSIIPGRCCLSRHAIP